MDPRTIEARRHHYEVESALATKLLSADRQARANLYSEVYEEMYQQVPDHPMLTYPVSAAQKEAAVTRQVGFLQRYLSPSTTFLEIGAGDCRLSFRVADQIEKAIAIEVSETISAAESTPDNFQLHITDGVSLPLPDSSVDVAYSNQLMEHLHPEDSAILLAEILRTLRPGGTYLCVTPSRLTGPHDVSRGFTEQASAFHLHEYTISEIDSLFRQVGFRRVGVHLGARGRYLPKLPSLPFKIVESVVERLPLGVRAKVTALTPMQMLLNVRVAAER